MAMHDVRPHHMLPDGSDDDMVAVWKLDESTSGDDALDDTGNYDLAPVSSPATGAGAQVVNSSLGARVFDGAADYFSATLLDTAMRNVLQHADSEPGYSVLGWFLPNSVTGDHTIIYIGGDTGTATTAHNTQLRIDTTGTELRCITQTGSGTNQIKTTTGLGLTTGRWYFFAITVAPPASGTAGRSDLTVRVWDTTDDSLFTESFADAYLPTGGTSGNYIRIGALAATAAKFWDGKLDNIAIVNFAATEEYARWVYLNAVSSFSEEMLYSSVRRYKVLVRVLVLDADNVWRDMRKLAPNDEDYLLSASWGDDIDAKGATAEIVFRRQTYAYSLAPEMTASRLNKDSAGSTDALLKLFREIKIETAVVPEGTSVKDDVHFLPAFHGFIDEVDPSGEAIKVSCRDESAKLDDVQIETERTYALGAGVDLAAWIDDQAAGSIVKDNEPSSGYRGGYPRLFKHKTYTAAPVNFRDNQIVSRIRVLDAIREPVTQIGGILKFQHNNTRYRRRFTLSLPDRAASPSLAMYADGTAISFGKDDYTAHRIGQSVAGIINRVIVEVFDKDGTPENDGTYPVYVATADDATSQAAYGVRTAIFSAAENIDSQAEADALASRVLNDLKDPMAEVTIVRDFFRIVDINDVITLEANGIHYDTNKQLAVKSYRHTIQADSGSDGVAKAETSMVMRERPVSGVMVWIGLIGEFGGVPDRPQVGPTTPAAPTVAGIVEGISISWPMPTNRGNRNYDRTEIHVGASGFTPSSATLKKIVRGASSHTLLEQVMGATKAVKLIHVDKHLNRSAASAEATATPRYTPQLPAFRAYRSASLTLTSTSGKQRLDFDAEQEDIGGNYNTSSPYTFTAPTAGMYQFSARAKLTGTASDLVALYLYDSSGVSLLAKGTVFSDHSLVYYPSISASIALAAGSTVSVYVVFTQSKTGNLAVKTGVTETFFSGSLLSQS